MLRSATYLSLLVATALVTTNLAWAEELPSQPESNAASEQPILLEDANNPNVESHVSADADYCGYCRGCRDYRGGCREANQCPMCQSMGCCRANCRPNHGFYAMAWLDQGFTGNTDSPRDRFNGPFMFNDRSNEYQMNQLYLILGRAVNKNRCRWDLGGRVDLLYGTDYYFTEAVGLETRQNGTPHWNSANGPRGSGAALYGLAMPQLYAEIFAPVGNGLTVKLGHFYTILGYESVMAPDNFFYSHSYVMEYGEPHTETGMLAAYDLSPCLNLQAGFTRGWDVWEDPNDSLDFIGGVTLRSPDERTTLGFALETGNEDPDGDNNRTVYSLVFKRRITPRLTYVFQHDLGIEANAALMRNDRVAGRWYGINQYLMYRLTCATTLGMRVEWFRDEHNTRVFNVPSYLTRGGNYTELTLGANWKPNQHVVVRPEIRWDHSNVDAPSLGVGGMYDDFTKKDQLTLAVDMILLR